MRLAAYDLGGPRDAAAPVALFAHATGFHGRVWEPTAAPLIGRYRCVAVDFRGQGASETPEGATLAWSGMADDIEAVCNSVLIRGHREVHGIGHSMGGAALVLAASRRPGLFRSLWLYEPAIVSPGVMSSGDGENPLAQGAARRRAAFASYDEAYANYAGKPPLNALHPEALHAYVRDGFSLRADGSVALRCPPATEAAVFMGGGTSGAFEVLSTLTAPVAVVAGRHEGFGPVGFVPSVLAQLSRGTLVERRHLGHFGPLEDPQGMARDIAGWIEAHRIEAHR